LQTPFPQKNHEKKGVKITNKPERENFQAKEKKHAGV
jgi:hypothetical protein